MIRYANLDENSISAEATKLKKKSKNNKDIIYKLEREGREPYYVVNGQVILFYKDRVREIDGKLSPSEPVSDIWTDVLPNDLHNEGGVDFRKGKKPEKLISRIIEIGSNPGDIVLDYHLGSGTTAAVAHKMGRRFIGIEQLNYGKNDPVVRIKRVLDGADDRGVSKVLNWQGGGDFVYMELAKWNDEWIEEIEKAKTGKELVKLRDEIKENAFLSYKVDPKTVDANAKDFADLSIADQKKFLIECLDKNQLYINLSEIEDKEYGVSKEDKALNKSFYNGK